MIRRHLLTITVAVVLACAAIGAEADVDPRKVDRAIIKAATNSQHGVVAELMRSTGITYDELPMGTLWMVCDAFLNMRDFRAFQTCMSEWGPRFEQDLAAGGKGVKKSGWGPDFQLLKMREFQTLYHLAVGDYDAAVDVADQALEIGREGSLKGVFGGRDARQVGLTNGYSLCAYANALAGNEARALECLEALRRAKKPWRFYKKKARLFEARTLMALGDYEGAADLLGSFNANLMDNVSNVSRVFLMPFLALAGGYSANWFEFELAVFQAHALYNIGEIENAEARMRELVETGQLDAFGGAATFIYQDMAKIARQRGDAAEAIANYQQAIELLERHRASIEVESAKLGFVADKQDLYVALVDLLVEAGEAARAFEVAERAKSRALVDMLAARREGGVTNPDSALATAIAQMTDSEAEDTMRYLPADTAASGVRGIEIVQDNLRAAAPQLASLVSIEATSAADVLPSLKSDLLVEFFGDDEQLFIFAVSSDGIRVTKKSAPELQDQVAALRDAVMTRAAYQGQAAALFALLFDDLAGELANANLTIVPHGPLHYLPFGALIHEGRHLAELADLRILPSASTLKYLSAPSDNDGVMILGNPDLGDPQYALPAAEQEARLIHRARPTSALFTGRRATETSLRRAQTGVSLLHIASHGTFNADSPLSSGLLLAPDDANDGFLSVAELYDMKLDVDLVTLSACETGLGETRNGDDVIGLTRGFLFAGARSMITSLWQVDDAATAELMTRIYSQIDQLGPRRALSQAQRELIARYPHPFYWAPFQFLGASL